MEKPKPIGSILEQTLKNLDIDTPLKIYSIWGAWREIVGESVFFQTKPRTIRNQVLFIDVSHPTWVHQLQFLKTSFLEKINKFLGEPLIKDIRFKLGKVSPSPPPSENNKAKDQRLDQKTIYQIENLISKITDEGVKYKLREVLVKSAKLERSRKSS